MWYAVALLLGLFREPTVEAVSLGVGWSEVTALDDTFRRAAGKIVEQCMAAGYSSDGYSGPRYHDEIAWGRWRRSGTAEECRGMRPPNEPTLRGLDPVFHASCVGVLAWTSWNSGDIWGRHTMVCTVTLHATCTFDDFDPGPE